MAQKLRKHGKKLEKTSVGCDIDFTILLSMLKVKYVAEMLPNLTARPSLAVRPVRPWPDHFFGRKWFRPDHNFRLFGRKCVSLFDFFEV